MHIIDAMKASTKKDDQPNANLGTKKKCVKMAYK
jgi:hypothetical protein